jgi:CheY-like chemotaxis protein
VAAVVGSSTFEQTVRPTVLVVDDDDANLRVMEIVLRSFGFDVCAAASCAEARACLDAARFDVLVADLSLGDGDALTLLAALGQRRPSVAVVVTGHTGPEHRARSYAAGFDAHLTKPLALDELERAVLCGLASQRAPIS